MPPFASTILRSQILNPKPSNPNIVTLNVGGQLFQTTPQTLSLAGPASLLSSPPSFIDRDPNLFSLLLSFLRTNRLPNSSHYSVADLNAEAEFYGLDPSLFSSSCSHLDAFDLQRSRILPLNGRDSPSAITTDDCGAVHVAHGGKITSFDWSLSMKSTVLTGLPAVDSLLAVDRSIVAAGAVDFTGLQILDLSGSGGSGSGSVKKTLSWNVIGSGSAAVQAIGSSPDHLFGSFESIRRNSSAVVAFDRTSFTQVAEIGKKEIYGADLDSAIPATKLQWVGGFNLLLASGSHAGPSGLTGNIRLWDVRSNNSSNHSNPVWELTEKVDCFSDVAVSDRAVFKVGVNSGDMFMMDLRKLGEGWNCIGRRVGNGKNGNTREGSGCLVEIHGGKVFVSRGGELEVWSEVLIANGMSKNEDGFGDGERVMRRNVMGRREDSGGKRILKLGFGGRRMVVVRKEEQCVEVWESSSSSRFC